MRQRWSGSSRDKNRGWRGREGWEGGRERGWNEGQGRSMGKEKVGGEDRSRGRGTRGKVNRIMQRIHKQFRNTCLQQQQIEQYTHYSYVYIIMKVK